MFLLARVVTLAGEDANAPRLIDRDIMLFVNGMQECIIGSMNWSFVTKRYFGDNGGPVKATRIVDPRSKEKEKARQEKPPALARDNAEIIVTTVVLASWYWRGRFFLMPWAPP